jgi:transcriptional regulator with XRE-family HTH domain
MSLSQEVGRGIRLRREQAGLSQAALAQASGRSYQMIGMIERGERSPSLETLEAIAAILHVAVRDFFPGTATPEDEFTAKVVGVLAGTAPPDRKRAYRVLMAMFNKS